MLFQFSLFNIWNKKKIKKANKFKIYKNQFRKGYKLTDSSINILKLNLLYKLII